MLKEKSQKPTKKLPLKTITLKTLSEEDLEVVIGGALTGTAIANLKEGC